MSVTSYWRPADVSQVTNKSRKLEDGPNPFNNSIFIRSTEKGIYHCEVIDILGRKVLSLTSDIPTLNIRLTEAASNLTEGNYFLRVGKKGTNKEVIKLTKSNGFH